MESNLAVPSGSVGFQENASSSPPSRTDALEKSDQRSYGDLPSSKESFGEVERHHPTFVPSISESVQAYEPTLFRGGHGPTNGYGGRITPGPRRFQYQPSSIDAPSYLTGTDGFQRSYYAGHSYIAVNPFLPSIAQNFVSPAHNIEHNTLDAASHLRPPTPMIPYSSSGHPLIASPTTTQFLVAFLFDTLPRQVYLHFQLRLPALYFSRVARIFEDAELSMPDIKRMAVVATNRWKEKSTSVVNANLDFEPSIVSPHFSHLKSSWEGFIHSLMREWKTLNIISVLLLSAILTILQIESAAADPITRYFALASLVCALMSLLYGCMFIIRFGTMRKAYKAAEWAEEAQKTRTSIWWNVWVLLATPAVWLSWSIIFYVACIMSFVWRTGTSSDPVLNLTPRTALAPRLMITTILTLGIVYFLLIVSTFWQYEDDKARKQRLLYWADNASNMYRPPSSYQRGDSIGGSRHTSLSAIHIPLPQPLVPSGETHRQHHTITLRPVGSLDPIPNIPTPLSFSRPPPDPPIYLPSFTTVKVMDLRFHVLVPNEMPPILLQRDITDTDWDTFIADGALTWNGEGEPIQGIGRSRPQDVTAHFIEWWNERFFRPRHVQAVLCQELSAEFPTSPMFAVYLVDLGPHPALLHGDASGSDDADVVSRFGSVPKGLERIDVFDPPDPDSRGSKPMGKTVILIGPHTARVHWGGGTIFRRDSAITPAQPVASSSNSDATTTSQFSGSFASDQRQQHMVPTPTREELGVVLDAQDHAGNFNIVEAMPL